MGYIENPKTKGSGIFCVIPQKEKCPAGCKDCFFQSGRSYLEPLEENLPNIPEVKEGVVYRINDGNDSSIDIDDVLEVSAKYPMKFYNTSFLTVIDSFDAPVVLTINPDEMTDKSFHKCESNNLMFVRFRCNTWNFRSLGTRAIMWYVEREVPVVLTFMAYHSRDNIPEMHREKYIRAKRTINDYWVIRNREWKLIMDNCRAMSFGKYIYSCGTSDVHECKFCGNCLQHYFRKITEMKNNSQINHDKE